MSGVMLSATLLIVFIWNVFPLIVFTLNGILLYIVVPVFCQYLSQLQSPFECACFRLVHKRQTNTDTDNYQLSILQTGESES